MEIKKRRYKAIEVQRKWKTRSLGRNQVEGQRTCTTTTTSFSGQQGRCDVHYPPLDRNFGLVPSINLHRVICQPDLSIQEYHREKRTLTLMGKLALSEKHFIRAIVFSSRAPHDSLSDVIKPQVGHPQCYYIR